MRKDIEKIKKQIEPILKEYKVKKASVFGSLASGSGSSESDVDILVELGEKRGLFTLAKMHRELEEELGKEVDLLTYNSVHPKMRDRVFKEMIQIYG